MTGRNRELKKLGAIADKIIARKAETSALSDAALRNKTWEFRRRLAEGETLDDCLRRHMLLSGRQPAGCWEWSTSMCS